MAQQATHHNDINFSSSNDLSCSFSVFQRSLRLAEDLLKQINAQQRELGETSVYKKVPEIDPEVGELLNGKRILIVDDQNLVLANWSPVLLTASMGTAMHLLHIKQSSEQLVKEIIEKDPEIILLDYSLANKLTGEQLVAPLKKALPNALIIGFSSEQESNNKFLKAGAFATADKSKESQALQQIAEAVKRNKDKALQEQDPASLSLFSEIERNFNQKYGLPQVQKAIKQICSEINLLETAGAGLSEKQRRAIGAARYACVLLAQTEKYESPLLKYLDMLCNPYFRDSSLENTLEYCDDEKIHSYAVNLLDKLRTCLPEGARRFLQKGTLVQSSFLDGNFALLYESPWGLTTDKKTRQIITQDNLITLENVQGHKYLSLSPAGIPFLRCTTSYGGGRAFFDGERLMAHNMFKTCAPMVNFFKNGYKVNCNNCSIINGSLFPLIEDRQHWLDDPSGSHIEVLSNREVRVAGEEYRSLGEFLPSDKFHDSQTGFTKYEWSEFMRFSH